MIAVNHNYRVTVYERDMPSHRLVALLGDGVPTPADGGGGHLVVGLPMRAPVTVWNGRPAPVTLTLPLRLVDEMDEPHENPLGRRGISHPWGKGYPGPMPMTERPTPLAEQTAVLTSMWRPADQTVAPPVLKLKAKHNLVPYSHLPFVISDFQWGAAQASATGYRILQDVTLVLLEYREDEQLQAIAAKSSSGSAHRTVYVVKKGDTLSAIAKRFHVKGGWKALGEEQHPPITDPRKLDVGDKLSIPAVKK